VPKLTTESRAHHFADKPIQFYSNNMTNLHHLTLPVLPHNTVTVTWPQDYCDITSPYVLPSLKLELNDGIDRGTGVLAKKGTEDYQCTGTATIPASYCLLAWKRGERRET